MILLIYIFILFMLSIVFLLLLYFIYSVIIFCLTGVPFMPTPKKYFQVLFNEVELKDKKVIYDLGCGTGSFLIAVRKKFGRNLKLIGYELSPALVWLARFRAYIKKSKINFVRDNFFKADISDADIIYLFLVSSI